MRSTITIRCILDDLEEEFAMFRKNQGELDDMDESQTMQDRIDQKQAFYNSKERALAIINKTNSPGTSFWDSVDLSEIQLPTFSEVYKDWPGFADQFRSAVHENPRIDDCKRLMYLRSCLT